MNTKKRSNHGGFLLVTCLGVVVFLTLGGTSLLVNGITESRLSTRLYNRSNALELAEAGLSQASLNLYTSEVTDDVMLGTLSSGSFQVETQQAVPGFSSLYEVQAKGTSQLENRQLRAYYQLEQKSVFQYALFGDKGVELSGNLQTDSYDSRLGLYDDDTANHNGDIGTNSTAAGGIDMSAISSGGPPPIDGQLFTGPGVADPEAWIMGFDASRVTGGTDPPSDGSDVGAMPAIIPMVPVTVPNGLTCIDATNPVPPPAPGNYCYHNLTLNSNTTWIPNGPVKIYLTGTLTITGTSDVGVESDPTQMIFYMTADSIGTITGSLLGTSKFYGAIYAPEATVVVGGNTEIFGAVSAEDIHATGSAKVHYDEAFSGGGGGPGFGTVSLKAWEEL